MRRKHVEYFCENCGKVEFEGIVFGREQIRHLQARSGDRTMLCQDCAPQPVKLPIAGLCAWFLQSDDEETAD
jgi:hypothetical protein